MTKDKRWKYPVELRKKALKMIKEGYNLISISKYLNINYSSVRNWVDYERHQQRMKDSARKRRLKLKEIKIKK